MTTAASRTMHFHGRSLAELENEPLAPLKPVHASSSLAPATVAIASGAHPSVSAQQALPAPQQADGAPPLPSSLFVGAASRTSTEDMEPVAVQGVLTESIITPVGGMSMIGDDTTTLADFAVIKELGRGGCATVYLATHLKTGEQVALKVLHESESRDTEVRERFRREASTASRIRHENVCAIRAFGEDPSGRLFLAFELLDGSDLGSFVRQHGPMPSAMAALVVGRLLEALAAAHSLGVLHRDIKPGNVMFTKSGQVKLVDFGIAKSKDDPALTAQGIVVGTPAYMCPEQIAGGAADLRWDLYAVGMTLFEMLRGENPYAHLQPSQAVMAIATSSLPTMFDLDPTVPGALEHVLEKLTARNPAKRYGSADEALADLRLMRSIVEQVQPELLARYFAAPRTVAHEIRHNLAELEIARADVLLAGPPANVPAAAFALYRAQKLDPRSALAARLQQLCTDARLAFDVDDDDLVDVLKAKVKKDPYNATTMKHIGERYRTRGDIYQAAIWFRRALRLSPGDILLRQQTDALLVGVNGMDAQHRAAVRETLKGVRMGLWSTVSIVRKQETLAILEPRAVTGPARVVVNVDAVETVARPVVAVGTRAKSAAAAKTAANAAPKGKSNTAVYLALAVTCALVGGAIGAAVVKYEKQQKAIAARLADDGDTVHGTLPDADAP